MGLELLRIWGLSRKTVVFVTHSVSEALFLADRVLMAARPGRVAEIHGVQVPRPRTLDHMSTPEFGEAAAYLRHLLGAKTGD